MFVQLHSVIVDGDQENRQELANFLTSFGVNLVGAVRCRRAVDTSVEPE